MAPPNASPSERTAAPAAPTTAAAPSTSAQVGPSVPGLPSAGYGAQSSYLSPRGRPSLLPSLGDVMRMQDQANAPVRTWLDANINSIRLSTVAEIRGRVRTGVPEAARRSDGDLDSAVQMWASERGVNLPVMSMFGPRTAPAAPVSDSALADSVRSALSSVVNGVDVQHGAGTLNISVRGLTESLRLPGGGRVEGGVGATGGRVGVDAGGTHAEATMSWGGTLGFQASRGPVHFGGELGPEGWRMQLSVGTESVAPLLGQLGAIFGNGETAMRGMVRTAAETNIRDITQIGDRVAPYLEPVGRAVEAAQGIMAAGRSSVSAGVSVEGSPTGGVAVMASLVVRF